MLFSLMHIVHLLTSILWIGGLAFVTILVFPMLYATKDPLQKALLFQRIEHRFAPIARIYSLVVGISGFAMLHMQGWHKALFTKAGAPLLFMMLIWVMWTIMLFGLEPVIIRRELERLMQKSDSLEVDDVFRRMNKLHWLLLALSLGAAASGAVFAHGPAL
ncbi:MAG TPA: hypothetical protein ENJ37_00500 [Deltaproteobacteria bacterium]|nr:hypothetical protein [Deltaproteobacteria bacterium]